MKRHRKQNKEKELPVCIVLWEDAHAGSSYSWTVVDDIDPDPYLVVSVGVMLDESVKPGHVTIIQSYVNECCDGLLHIPLAMVKEVKIVDSVPDFTSQG
jgi:hypothetical protein